jgi:hypothetical protein
MQVKAKMAKATVDVADVLAAAQRQARQDTDVLKAQDVLAKLQQRRQEVQQAINAMVEDGKSGTARAGDAALAAARGESATVPVDGADLLKQLAALDAAMRAAESQVTGAMAQAAGRAVVGLLPTWRALLGDVASAMGNLSVALTALAAFRESAGLLREQLEFFAPPVRPEVLKFRSDALAEVLTGLDRQIQRAAQDGQE